VKQHRHSTIPTHLLQTALRRSNGNNQGERKRHHAPQPQSLTMVTHIGEQSIPHHSQTQHIHGREMKSCGTDFLRRDLMLQSTQFFVLLPTPSNLRTRRTSRTNHTDPSEYIPTNSTTIDTSQSTHTYATHHLQPSDTSDPNHVAYSHAPTFLYGILHGTPTSDHESRYRERWR